MDLQEKKCNSPDRAAPDTNNSMGYLSCYEEMADREMQGNKE